VTIKDAPCEVSDQFIATHMSKYGQVINGSIKRGVIKGTNIENGTRYVDIIFTVLGYVSLFIAVIASFY
jgi:hypothetical protein